MYSQLATCYKPVSNLNFIQREYQEGKFRNLMDFLVYLSRLFKISKETEINKVNDRSIKLNSKIGDYIKLKKKQEK